METLLLFVSLICHQPTDCKWWEKCLENAYDTYADIAIDASSNEPVESIQIKSIEYCIQEYKDSRRK